MRTGHEGFRHDTEIPSDGLTNKPDGLGSMQNDMFSIASGLVELPISRLQKRMEVVTLPGPQGGPHLRQTGGQTTKFMVRISALPV